MNPALPQHRELKTHLKMKLHLNAGDSGTAIVEDYTKFLAEGCSSITPEMWNRFKSDQTGGLLNLGLMSSLVVSISLLFSSPSYLASYITFSLFYVSLVFQSSLCMLRHNANAKMQVDFLNAKVVEAQKTLKDALLTADSVSKDQENKIKNLEKSVDDLKASNTAVDKEILQEKKANIEAKEKIPSLEDQVDTLKDQVKMLEDNLATERAELAQKVSVIPSIAITETRVLS